MKTEPMNSEAYWDERFSTDWDENQGPAQTRFFAALAIGHLPPWLESDIRVHGLSVVDFGCATGDAVPMLARHLGVPVSGVDVSAQALNRARQRFPGHAFHQIHDVALPEEVDVLFTSNTLEHFHDPQQTLSALLPRVRKYAVVLVPFQEPEESRLDEHFVSFDFHNVPLGVGGFRLLGYRVLDTARLSDSLWDGKQILLVYGREGVVSVDSSRIASSTTTEPGAMTAEAAIGAYRDEVDSARAEAETLREALDVARRDFDAQQRQLADLEYEVFVEQRRVAEVNERLAATTSALRRARGLLEEFRVSVRNKLVQLMHSVRFKPGKTAMATMQWAAGTYKKRGVGLIGGLSPDDAIAPIAKELETIDLVIHSADSPPPSSYTRRPLTPGERGVSMKLSPQRPRVVSVVLPVYNQASMLEDSILSVLNQSWKELELIIVNDGSTDGVEQVLKKYVDDPRVIVLSGPNQKLPNALNSGFARATGEYWTWTSADNVMLPNQIEVLVNQLIAHQEWAMVYSDYQAIDDRGAPLNDPRFRPQNQDPADASIMRLPQTPTEANLHDSGDNYIGASFLYRRSAATAVGNYVSDTFGGEDYDFWLRIHTLFDIGHVPEVLYKYRVHDNTLNARAAELGLYDNVRRLLDRDRDRRRAMLETIGFQQVGVEVPLPSSGTLRAVICAYSGRKLQAVRAALAGCSLSVCIIDGPTSELSAKQLEPFDLFVTSDERAWETVEAWHPGRVLLIDLTTHPELFVQIARYRAFERQFSRPTHLALAPFTSRKIHVALQARSMSNGGLEQVIFSLASKIDRTRFDVSIIVESDEAGELGKALQRHGVSVHPVGRDVVELERVVKRANIDVVNLHYSTFGLDVYRRLKVPVVYTLHNSYTWLAEDEVLERRRFFAEFPKFIAVSREVARYAANRFGVSPGRLQVIPNGYADDHFPPPATLTRADLGLKDSDYIFINVGSISSVKGQHVLLTAVRELKNQHPEIKLLIVGGIADDELAAELNRRIRDEGLVDNVRFLGQQSRARVAAMLQLSDAFVLSSVHEGWSIALMEAMAFGLPIIATDTGSAQDIIPGSRVGTIVPNAYQRLETVKASDLKRIGVDPRPDHLENIKRAMADFATHPDVWQQRGANGPVTLKNFTLDRQVAAYQAVFEEAWGVYKKQIAEAPPAPVEESSGPSGRRLPRAWLEAAKDAVSTTWRQGAERADRVALAQLLRWHGSKPIVVFPPVIDWSVPIYQRPQHLALQLARQGVPYFFTTPNARFDKVHGVQRLSSGCYLTDRYDLLLESEQQKVFHLLSTDMNYGAPHLPRDMAFIERELKAGNRILYEYIDEIHPAISGTAIPKEIYDRHELLLRDERVAVVATASKLYDEVAKKRSRNFELVTNGVDYEHFSKAFARDTAPPELEPLINSKRPIIGYFGALAEWFDYELTLKMAEERNWNILLIGFDYDGSMHRYGLSHRSNPRVIGPIPYKDLPRYARWFDVATIPFRVNDITESTSPIKLFEYMAMGKPIVTTEMPECRKYKSVLVGRDHSEFVSLVDRALGLRNDPGYAEQLKADALANTWASKAHAIADLLAQQASEAEH